MEHSYVGDLIPSINSYQKIIDQYERGLKKGEFYDIIYSNEKDVLDFIKKI